MTLQDEAMGAMCSTQPSNINHQLQESSNTRVLTLLHFNDVYNIEVILLICRKYHISIFVF